MREERVQVIPVIKDEQLWKEEALVFEREEIE